jgi:hypothetical protein
MILVTCFLFVIAVGLLVVSYDGMRHHRNKHNELLEMSHRQAIETSGALLAANEAHTRSLEKILDRVLADRDRLFNAALAAVDPNRARMVAVLDQSAPIPRPGVSSRDLYDELLAHDSKARAQADEFQDDEGNPIVPVGMSGGGNG